MVSSTADTSYIPQFNAKCVQLVLDINAELIRVCVEFQNRGWFQDPDFAVYQARLQSNLAYLASVADHFLKTPQLSGDPDLQSAKQRPAVPSGTSTANPAPLIRPDLSPLPTPRTPAGQKLQALLVQTVQHFQQRDQLARPEMLERSREAFQHLNATTTAGPPSTNETQSATAGSDNTVSTGMENQPSKQAITHREVDPPIPEGAVATAATVNNGAGNGTAGDESPANAVPEGFTYTPLPPFHTRNIHPQPPQPSFLMEQELKRQRLLQSHIAQMSSTATQSPAPALVSTPSAGQSQPMGSTTASPFDPTSPYGFAAPATPSPAPVATTSPPSIRSPPFGMTGGAPTPDRSHSVTQAPTTSTAAPTHVPASQFSSPMAAPASSGVSMGAVPTNMAQLSRAQQIMLYQMRMQQMQQAGATNPQMAMAMMMANRQRMAQASSAPGAADPAAFQPQAMGYNHMNVPGLAMMNPNPMATTAPLQQQTQQLHQSQQPQQQQQQQQASLPPQFMARPNFPVGMGMAANNPHLAQAMANGVANGLNFNQMMAMGMLGGAGPGGFANPTGMVSSPNVGATMTTPSPMTGFPNGQQQQQQQQ
ncbi:hypothetical protein IWQ60_011139 [Tieghemiomyces parasiticus]|uniref:SS18 N-terminal domain-containing protein n=1 Tax=Tieghemiomyces parasiticus TaxID=78921 RepID=A0A9W7ZPM2_9FUNG|nr:hypothetical protein IWQ60_011139 [Tieghemiomyces parasiticus]